ncbi:NitT/TauT family transport system ATP-binding protein [Anaerospora hongkongensis]|uniref:NitT/TauT family transport system ATP-binding protein n=1 Tax=Anaerospora hongkongensis TaxID=244830 RepID=A0A4V2Q8F3_9FIRM|nr:ABC transporter ATP-binding protein [Anaerospora hongkongensis]TCL36173.1 NitT/TauT family transport system ATP-binding protein [Anaerospora hongkongensis]
MADKLIIDNVSKIFSDKGQQVTALQNTSFTVSQNEFITILGPSGCGKSTILKIIAGLEEPSSGKVLLDGREIKGPGSDRGMVFQSYTLFPWLTVQQNIEFGLDVAGKTKAERQDIACHYLEKIGLTGFEKAYPSNLSGGMKQRVAIARALANDPQVLLMDEPFGALDAQTRTVMQELLLTVWEESHKTILFVTHDVDEAIFMGDTIYVMTARPGKIKARLEVPLLRSRTYDMKLADGFVNLKKQALELIREESWKTANSNM